MSTATAQPTVKTRRATGINSLRVKILMVLLVFSLLPILVLGQTWQIIIENETNKQAQLLERQAFALTDTIAGRIKDGAEGSLAEAINGAQLSSNTLRLDILRQDRNLGLPQVLNNLLNSRPLVSAVAFAGTDGKVIQAFNKGKAVPGTPAVGDDISDQSFFVIPANRSRVISVVITPPGNQQPVLLMGFPVQTAARNVVGVLLVTLDLNSQFQPLIEQIFSGSDKQLAQDVRAYVVDNKGTLLARSDNMPQPANPAQFAKSDAVLKAMVSGENQQAHMTQGADPASGVNGVESILNIKPEVFSPTGDRAVELGLIVTVQEPEDVALAPVKAFRKQADDQRTLILVVTIFAAIFAVIISILAALGLVNPIRRLTHGARRIASGELDTRVEVKSRDEIGELADDFNIMAQKLKAANAVAESYLNPKAAEMVRRSYTVNDNETILGHTEEKEMTLFFSDIVSFTTSTEKLGPAMSIARLNAYYEVVTTLLQQQGGKIDKYVADEIVAIFEDGSDHAFMAVKAAVQTLQALEKWNREGGFEPVRIRIGINTGECIVANIGSRAAMRFDRTVIGDAVNTTQRLMTAGSPNSIIISEDTYHKMKDRVEVAALEPLALKGKAQKVAAYQVKGFYESGRFIAVEG